jgi:hypothetical protein
LSNANQELKEMRSMKKFVWMYVLLTGILSLGFFSTLRAQNVGVNATGATPDASAMLDISSTTSGVLIPRVALTATNTTGPVTSPAVSLLVYNTATAGT